MKRYYMTALLLGTFLFSGLAQAAVKIGVVDVARVFQEVPQREKVAQQLRQEFEGRIKELQALEKEMQTLVEKEKRDGALMSESQRTEMARQMESLQADYRLKGRALEEDERRRQLEERNRLLAEVKEAVDAIAKKEKYDLVLQASAVAYVDQAHDISNKVIDMISKQK